MRSSGFEAADGRRMLVLVAWGGIVWNFTIILSGEVCVLAEWGGVR
jgi:hypothetical protein